MKLIEKFLIKRCSTEVQLMLTRMRERPEDFDYGTGWRALVEKADDVTYPFTSVERKMVRAYWKECRRVRGRKELLARIMNETINPSTREQLEDGLRKQYAANLASSMQYTKQQLQGGILQATGTGGTQWIDPRAVVYQQVYQNQNALQGRAHP